MSSTHKAAQKFPNLIENDWGVIPRNEWELLTSVMLDARTPTERLRVVLRNLREVNLLDFRELIKLSEKEVQEELKWAGYPWWGQKAKCFKPSNLPAFDLKTATVEQMMGLYGIGPKLSNLWMRFMHPDRQDDFVVIDTHMNQWIAKVTGVSKQSVERKPYAAKAEFLRGQATIRGMTVSELDEMIVTAGIQRRMARKGLNSKKGVPIGRGN